MKPNAIPYIQGVPSAGHVNLRNGAWHPGRIDGCPKCYNPERTEREARR